MSAGLTSAVEKVSSSDPDDYTDILQRIGVLSTLTFPDSTTALQTYLHSIMQMCQMRSACVAEIRDGIVSLIAASDNGGCGLKTGLSLPLHETFCQYVDVDDGPLIVSDAANDTRVVDVVARRMLNIGAYVSVPLMLSDGRYYGTLCVLDPLPRDIQPDHIALLRIFARQIAAIIESMQQFQSKTTIENVQPSSALESTFSIPRISDMLTQMIAHDVRNPLTTIYGYIDLLIDEGTNNLTEEQSEALQLIQQSVVFVNRLMKDLLDVGSLHQYAFKLITSPFDPFEVMQQAVAECQLQAEKKDLTIHIHKEGIVPNILGDADRLHQVLLNLLGNAIRYTPAGWIRLHIAPCAEGVEIRVIDSGPGISPELHETIWLPYTRGSSRRNGYGLGLYIVQQLVHAMGGSVGLESEIGSGSQFWVRLPLHSPGSQQFKLP